MNELNFKPATGGGLAGDRTVAVPALDTSASTTSTTLRDGAQARHQRRRLNVLRFPADAGFRPFRVY